MMKHALLYIPDIFFAPRIADALKHLGFSTQEVDPRADLATTWREAALLIVQLSPPREMWQKLIENAHAAQLPILAFGQHTQADVLRAARQAGASKVVPNSQLVAELPQLIEQVCSGDQQ